MVHRDQQCRGCVCPLMFRSGPGTCRVSAARRQQLRYFIISGRNARENLRAAMLMMMQNTKGWVDFWSPWPHLRMIRAVKVLARNNLKGFWDLNLRWCVKGWSTHLVETWSLSFCRSDIRKAISAEKMPKIKKKKWKSNCWCYLLAVLTTFLCRKCPIIRANESDGTSFYLLNGEMNAWPWSHFCKTQIQRRRGCSFFFP